MVAIAGVGWTLLPKNMLSEELVTVSINRPLSRRLGLVYHKKRSLSNTAKALKNLILN
jgi:DNA-binding transcriptional LysR family regulator